MTTGFNNDDHGAFTNTIKGGGDITVVPEPSALWLLGSALAALALGRFRRR